MQNIEPGGSKECTRCKIVYPNPDEHFSHNGRGYYASRCKACKAELARAKRDLNPFRGKLIYIQRVNPSMSATLPRFIIPHFMTRRFDPFKNYMGYLIRRQDPTHKAKERQRMRIQRKKPHVQVRERLYRQSFTGKASQKARKNRRRVKAIANGGTFTKKDILLQYRSQRGKCWWCGCTLGTEYHADHLTPLDRGGTSFPNNIVVTCPACNLSKGAKMPSEWIGRLL